MQVLSQYPLPPGCCALCRGNATPLIDTELNTDDLPVEFGVEQSGWVYVCRQCVESMGRMLNMLTAAEVTTLRQRLNGVNQQFAGERDAHAATKKALLASEDELARVWAKLTTITTAQNATEAAHV